VNRLARTLVRLDLDLRGLGVSWALVGGFAVSVRTEPRMTRDLDVAVAVEDDSAAERLVRELRQLGYADGNLVLEQEATGRLATVRLISPAEAGDVVVDLLFASSGIEAEVAARATRIEILPDVTAPVAAVGDLLALKILAGREQDGIDAAGLARVATAEDLRQAASSLEEIERRGFHRTRQDLAAALARAIERARRAR
jgi:predicted nucleotidyltransferase